MTWEDISQAVSDGQRVIATWTENGNDLHAPLTKYSNGHQTAYFECFYDASALGMCKLSLIVFDANGIQIASALNPLSPNRMIYVYKNTSGSYVLSATTMGTLVTLAQNNVNMVCDLDNRWRLPFLSYSIGQTSSVSFGGTVLDGGVPKYVGVLIAPSGVTVTEVPIATAP